VHNRDVYKAVFIHLFKLNNFIVNSPSDSFNSHSAETRIRLKYQIPFLLMYFQHSQRGHPSDQPGSSTSRPVLSQSPPPEIHRYHRQAVLNQLRELHP